MYCTILSGALRGVESYLAHVEVDISRGLPGFEMVGLLGSEVKEARERIRVALKNADMELPPCRVTVNISPADEHKTGTGFDLPVAVGILTARGLITPEAVRHVFITGELGLNGEVAAVKGILPLVREAQRRGADSCVVPLANLREARQGTTLPVMGVSGIREAAVYLAASREERERLRKQCEFGDTNEENCLVREEQAWFGGREENREVADLSEVKGQESAKRAVLIAAAGAHHLLLMGPPGAGKTLLASCISGILPPMEPEEKMEVSAVYSVTGRLESKGIVEHRPFVAPHHTISPAGLIGGGSRLLPGMVSLAHKGVLFLDEMTECRRGTLDLLRQPMEERCVRIARNRQQIRFPAEFMLVGAANPCPCGYFPDRERCRCRESEIRRYLGRLSGPLLDRFDLCAQMTAVKGRELFAQAPEKKRAENGEIRRQVEQARKRQQRRYQGTGVETNSRLSARLLQQYCPLGAAQQSYLEQLMDVCGLSARACHRIWRVARTIGDLEGCDTISVGHLGEAACYRLTEAREWQTEQILG